jgi:hypothetical protein
MEKRRHQRILVDLPVTVRCKGKLIPATALNVSCGGMYLETEAEGLTENAMVEVTFDLNGDTRDVSLCGVISRVEHAPSPRVGVQFASPFSPGHKILRDYLRKNLN